MKYCTTCLQPDTRPNSVFTPDGQCPACAYFETARDIDWQERHEIIEDLVAPYRGTGPDGFDCIIGVSGGKDSTRQALWVRDKLDMTPLLVSLSHPPQQVSDLGVDNVSNLINLGFDVVLSSPAPETWRRLMHDSFMKFSNWARSSELALFSSVPQLAIRYGIPLIFWGENPALQVGDLKTMGRNGYDGNNLRNSNTLSSGHDWMLSGGYAAQDIIPYIYPGESEFDSANIQIVFLGWFLGDWSLVNNAGYACSHGLGIRNEHPGETGDLLGLSNLDEDWHNMNQMVKYLKFGFGKTTEYVNEAMRAGTVDRATAVDLVERYDGRCSPRYIKSFCDFIGISTDQFWLHVHASTNRDLFDIGSDGSIKRRFRVGVGL
ncbi:N-acetyl sugar amidotransferase [Denitromonas ohlonensis]|uniref:N-acetyl sugar amidotransferase n=2 Tax=Denitromonas TaxID=139331 RepID=A0A557R526_9RHOO|nr:N-acetyl sugar amidotransferase [Denitromonas ohlonensis]TVO60265.1 N-acetyl sugar amidotransferase [Denitromonas ohlonensis]TVO75756.1 N-acetyl sugar amidotransferase [Denitromonas ohlonensis]